MKKLYVWISVYKFQYYRKGVNSKKKSQVNNKIHLMIHKWNVS